MRSRAIFAALVLTALCPPQAYAQIGNRLAIGGTIGGDIAGGSETEGSPSVTFEWRIGHDKPGWGWQYALNWFETGITTPIGGQSMDIGAMHVRPLMGGYGYTFVKGRASITTDLIGGYAFSSFDWSPAADAAYRTRLGTGAVTTDAGNTFVIKPEVHAWYDLSKKLGLIVTGGYLVARPSVTITSSLGDDVRRINADRIMVNAGLVYRIF